MLLDHGLGHTLNLGMPHLDAGLFLLQSQQQLDDHIHVSRLFRVSCGM